MSVMINLYLHHRGTARWLPRLVVGRDGAGVRTAALTWMWRTLIVRWWRSTVALDAGTRGRGEAG